MLYSYDLSIPAGTSQIAPYTARIPLTRGYIRHVWLRWRWGVGNLAGFRLSYNGRALYPINLSSFIPSFHDSIEFSDEVSLSEEPYELYLEAYNLDDTYDHSLWIGLLIDRQDSVNTQLIYLGTLLESLVYG